jgi:hypothetical protein
MPLPITRGAASAKAFGWTKQSGGAGYAYVGMNANTRAAVTTATSFGTTGSGTNFTSLATQPSAGALNGLIGIVADGRFICTTGNYSLDNGATWAQLTGSGTIKYVPPGVNGAIAYSTTSKRAFAFALGAFGKTGDIGCAPITITNTGSIIGSTSFSIGAGPIISNATYSPAFNYFYVNAFTNSANTFRYINAASPATGTNVTLGTPSHYRPGISDDGYPLIPINTGGSNFDLRKYTSSDLSTYTSFGTVSDSYFGQSTKSAWLWFPVNNKYIVMSGISNSVTCQSSTSGSPQSLSLLGTFSPGQANAIFCLSVSEDATGKLICSGIAQYAEPKGGQSISNFCFFSTDGGVGWTNYGQTVFGASKNFT